MAPLTPYPLTPYIPSRARARNLNTLKEIHPAKTLGYRQYLFVEVATDDDSMKEQSARDVLRKADQ
jgi:hypothetical protein